ncbi:MAG: hypothetical protein ACRDP2_02850 [Nocardioidaceae bacterium]
MTEQRVRELLTEVADAVPPPDTAERAWRRSVRVRRRRVAGTALLAVGVVVATIGVVGVLHDGAGTLPNPDGDRGSAPVANPNLPEAALARAADARTEGGGKAWIGPTIEEDERLPAAGSALPPSIDLDQDIEATEQPGRSLAAFAASDPESPLTEVMLLDRDGGVSRLEVQGLDTVLKPDGDDDDSADEYVLPLNISSLSPDGTQLVLAQDHEVVLYDLVDGTDRTLPTYGSESYYVGWTYNVDDDRWMIQLPRDLLDHVTGKVDVRSSEDSEDSEDSDGIVAIWPERTLGEQTAQAFLGRSVRALGPEIGDDPVLIEVTGPRHALLALPGDEADNHLRPRSRVVAWLGDDTVAFQSQDYGSYRVLGWETDSGAVHMLSEAELPEDWNQGVIASWADIPQ